MDFLALLDQMHQLAPSERLRLLQAQHHLLSDGRDLLEVLPLLGSTKRLSFVQAHADKMLGYDLVYVLHALASADRLACAEQYHAKIENGIHLAGVLHELPVAARAKYLGQQLAKIQTSAELSWILDLFDETEMMAVAAKYPLLKTPKDTEIFLEKLSPEHAVIFLKQHPELFNEGSTLAIILKILPQSQRLAFAKLHQDKIQDMHTLSFVLYQLPPEQRLGFVQALLLPLKAEDVLALMRTLSASDRKTLLLQQQALLKKPEQVLQALRLLPQASCKADFPHSKIWTQALLTRQLDGQQWQAYWQTAQQAKGLFLDWPQLLQQPKFYASLLDPLHAKIFISLTTPKERYEQLQLLAQAHPKLHPKVMLVLASFTPANGRYRLFQPPTPDQGSAAAKPKPFG